MTAYGIRFESAVVRVANDARVEGLGIDTQDTNNQGLEQQPQRRDVPRDPFGPRVQRREGKRRIHEVARKRASGKSCSCAALPQAPNRSTGLPTAPSGPVGVGSRHFDISSVGPRSPRLHTAPSPLLSRIRYRSHLRRSAVDRGVALSRRRVKLQERDRVAPRPILAAAYDVDAAPRQNEGSVVNLKDPSWIR